MITDSSHVDAKPQPTADTGTARAQQSGDPGGTEHSPCGHAVHHFMDPSLYLQHHPQLLPILSYTRSFNQDCYSHVACKFSLEPHHICLGNTWLQGILVQTRMSQLAQDCSSSFPRGHHVNRKSINANKSLMTSFWWRNKCLRHPMWQWQGYIVTQERQYGCLFSTNDQV